jgi:voltage-gated potassium channel
MVERIEAPGRAREGRGPVPRHVGSLAGVVLAPGLPRPRVPLPEVRSLRARLLFSLSLVAAVIVAGTLGYAWLWRNVDASWLDALFMTVTTITTIGYGEVRPLDGPARIFTMLLAMVGIGSLFYTFGAVMEYLVTVRLGDPTGRRRMERRVAQLSGHVIVAGLGRVGRQAVEQLQAGGVPFVVVDPAEPAVRAAEERGWLVIHGDATEDDVLARAGVARARGLIATTANDATNMYIVLSARVLNSGLTIVSRAVDEASMAKLIRAGANRAISPYAIGGHRLAHLILSPTVVDFFETALRRDNQALNIEDLAIAPGSPAAGKTLDALGVRRATGATVLVILREGANPLSPAGDASLEAGDRLLALGTVEQLRRLEVLLSGG